MNTDLKERIETLVDIEQRSASMSPITPLYVSRMLNEPLEEVEATMKEMKIGDYLVNDMYCKGVGIIRDFNPFTQFYTSQNALNSQMDVKDLYLNVAKKLVWHLCDYYCNRLAGLECSDGGKEYRMIFIRVIQT